MANPWDPLPLPLIGDSSQQTIFESLGRTLDRWEYVEVGLSIMYSLFVGDTTFVKMREYGLGKNIFKDRLNGLRVVANDWFIKHPDQANEGAFEKLTRACAGFADRRNEFAHGVTMDVQGIHFWTDKLKLASPGARQFLVVPSLHVVRKYDVSGLPIFGYSSQQLNIIYDRLADLELEVDHFKKRLWPKYWHPI